MAEGKNKIVVYADWLDNFEDLTDEELGKLMRHFFMYVNDMDPVLEDRLLNIAWKPIQATLKRDLKKWESFVDKQKANGKKGGRPKTQKTQALNEKPKKAVSVSDSVSVNEVTKVTLYCKNEFFEDWNNIRTKHLKKPSNLNRLARNEEPDFNELSKTYAREEFQNGLEALFRQENINFDSMHLRPKHFLEHFETYQTAFEAKTTGLYGRKAKQDRL